MFLVRGSVKGKRENNLKLPQKKRIRAENFEKCSILFEFKGYSAEERNWTAARLPDRAIPQDCGRVNAKI